MNMEHSQSFSGLSQSQNSEQYFTSQSSLHIPSSLSQQAPDAVPLEQRRHPRRSRGVAKPPPTLVRQDERKATFVDSLVDSATQMVEVIWPLSVASCRSQAGSGVLSLRRYIEETLRRSRTSYSTLQVALYYLVLIMPCVPKTDFTKQQTVDCASTRALQCGRRMFLAALILASKYLQDRNYSANAWSKMSGLKVGEINMNERAFLESVNWKLHISGNTFKRWTDVVLRYTPSQSPPTAGQSFSVKDSKVCWKTIIPLLTPDLEQVAPCAPVVSVQLETPPAYSTPPSYLEPRPEVVPPTPAFQGNVGYLPTPRLTPPQSVHTPAVSVVSVESFRSVCSMSRRGSFTSEASTALSPVSMVSDASRLSRSSSVSSVSTGASSQQKPDMMTMTAYDAQPYMASRAVKRSRSASFDSEEKACTLQARVSSMLKKEGGMYAPIVVEDDDCAGNSLAADAAQEQVLGCMPFNSNKRIRTSYA